MAFRILSFCGGGVRGLMSATILKRLDDEFQARHPGKTLAGQADMYAGTSTGASIAGLLLKGHTPEKIIDFYHSTTIPAFRNAATDPNRPALPPTRWAIAILDFLDLDHKISSFEKYALFTSFDIGADGVPWSPQLFHNLPNSQNSDIRLLDAMMASGSMPGMTAPYPYSLDGRKLHLIDGAFVHHDPTVPAIAIAADNGHDVASISAIDIGTGFMRNFMTADTSEWGANQWINGTGEPDGALPPLLVNSPWQDKQMPFLNLCLNGTSTNLMPDLAAMLLGDRYAYLNPDFGPKYIPEDATDQADLDFLVAEAEGCDLTDALAVLDAYWVD